MFARINSNLSEENKIVLAEKVIILYGETRRDALQETNCLKRAKEWLYCKLHKVDMPKHSRENAPY